MNNFKEFEYIKTLWTPEAVKGRELSMYVDNPFCMSRCTFCDYCEDECIVPANSDEFKNYYLLLEKEIEKGKILLKQTGKDLDKMYLGGGTTTIMPAPTMRRIFDTLPQVVKGEKKIECNPLLLSNAKIDLIIEYGFNAVSLGVQSLDPDVLKANNRKFLPIERLNQIIDKFRAAGVRVNTDLMAYIGNETNEDLIALEYSIKELQKTNTDIITIYPKHNAFHIGNVEISPDGLIKSQMNYIRGYNLRKMVMNATDKHHWLYEIADKENKEKFLDREEVIRYGVFNLRIIRNGLDLDKKGMYISSSPPNHPDHQAVIGIGGLQYKDVYSYIGRSGVIYYNTISNNGTNYVYNLKTGCDY